METTTTLRDVLWLLMAAAMVMLMQGGFTLLESGLVRAKNSINVAIKNLVDFCLSSALFWMVGFALMFGTTTGGWFGTSNFFLMEDMSPWKMAFFLFQLVFAGTATTIVSGAVSERISFSGYMAITVVIAGLIYPILGHWVWGGLAGGTTVGWLAQMGFIDFAGATVVHSVGGWIALAAIMIVGPRTGRFDAGKSQIRGHNLPLAALGVLLLWFGWFGFNGGSTFRLTEEIPYIMVNTLLAGAFGGLMTLVLSWILYRHPKIELVISGILAGLVAITASANFATITAAILIGAVGGAIALALTKLLESVQIDDPVAAVPVHVGAGIWGTLAVALFGSPAVWNTGLGRMEQLTVQGIGVIATFIWAFGVGFGLLWLVNRFIRFRVSPRNEQVGLNMSEHRAQTDLLNLLNEMEEQRISGDMTIRATVEPHTEVGQIATQYNRVLDSLFDLITTVQHERDSLQHSIIKLLEEVSDVGSGDLTIEAEVTEDATGALADSFNFMIGQLRDIINNVQRSTQQVNQSASEAQNTARLLAQQSELQATQLAQTSTTVDDMANSVKQVSESATISAAVAVQAKINAQQGTTAVRDTIEGMTRIRNQVQETSKRIKRLGESSQEIGEIVQVIRDIAKRTSILSLNASLEAAAAGEAGRGFAVVAEDVKRLAERSAAATHQISDLVRGIQSETNSAVSAMEESTHEVVEGSRLAHQAGQALIDIESVSSQLAELIASISATSQQQAQGSEIIVRSMTEIAQITQQTATGTQDAAQTISTLASLASELRNSVSTFKLPVANGREITIDR